MIERRATPKNLVDLASEVNSLTLSVNVGSERLEAAIKRFDDASERHDAQIKKIEDQYAKLEKNIETLVTLITAVNGTKTFVGWVYEVGKGLLVIGGGVAVVWHWLIRDISWR